MDHDLLFNSDVAQAVATALVTSGAYRISKTSDRSAWFRWKSGISAPVYCNVRELASHPRERDIVVDGLTQAFRSEFDDCLGVLGMATAGIGWASMLSHTIGMPMGYVRSTKKLWGLGNDVEYFNRQSNRVLILDDLVASGSSIQAAASAVTTEGLHVGGILSVVNWGFPKMRLRLAGHRVRALVSYQHMVGELGLPTDAEADLLSFYRAPEGHRWKCAMFAEGTPRSFA